jgi:tetratricopeptide (TPR) repeat protein
MYGYFGYARGRRFLAAAKVQLSIPLLNIGSILCIHIKHCVMSPIDDQMSISQRDAVAASVSRALNAPLRHGKEQREQLITKGDDFRDLGFYTKALRCYREAENDYGNLELALRIGKIMARQGRVRIALEEINKSAALYYSAVEDKELVAVAEMLRISLDITISIRFRDGLRKARQLYDEHLQGVAVEQLNESKVSQPVPSKR